MAQSFFNTPVLMGHNEGIVPPMKSGAHAMQLFAGPACMILVLGLQNLKKNLTGSHSSKLYETIWKFISKAEARDKTGRIVQYFCRSLQGFMGHMAQDHPLLAWKPVVAEVQSTLAWARRTHRWGKAIVDVPRRCIMQHDGALWNSYLRTPAISHRCSVAERVHPIGHAFHGSGAHMSSWHDCQAPRARSVGARTPWCAGACTCHARSPCVRFHQGAAVWHMHLS